MSTATDFAQANYITQHDMHAENAWAFAAQSAQTSGASSSVLDTLIAEGKRDQSMDVQTAVLRVSGMPTRLRPAIERAMVQCISTQSEYVIPGDDPLTAQWCTRWYRDTGFDDDLATLAAFPGVELPAPRAEKCVGCRQVITGTSHELRALNSVVATLAEEFGFSARVDAA
ncbi:MAG: hypothetical protein L0L74_07005 [Corynebacterium casei]|nr:hypothetical protein [Corynebacterium casei]